MSAGLAFIGLGLITRYLGADVYGSITFTLGLLTLFNSVSDLGFGSAHVKRVSEGQDINDSVATFAGVKIVLTLLMVVVSLVSIFVWTSILGGYMSSETYDMLFIFILYFVFYNLASIAIYTYQGTMEIFKSQVIQLMDPVVRVPLILIIALGRGSAIQLAYAYVIASLAVVLLSLLLLKRDKIRILGKPTLFRSYLVFATPLILVTMISTVSGSMSAVIIGFSGTKFDVGYYTASLALVSMVGLVGVSVAMLTFPSFSTLHTDGNKKEIRQLTLQAERYLSMIGLPMILVIALFPTQTAEILLGGTMAPAGTALGFLAIGTLLYLLNTVHSSQILAVNRPDLSAKVTIASFVFFLFALLILVPSSLFGVKMLGLSYTGAAIAYMLNAFFCFAVIRVIVWRLTSTGWNSRLWLHLGATAVAGLVLFAMSLFIPITSWYYLIIIYGGASAVVFALVLILFRELTWKDVSYFADLLNVRKLLSYIRSEVKGKNGQK